MKHLTLHHLASTLSAVGWCRNLDTTYSTVCESKDRDIFRLSYGNMHQKYKNIFENANINNCFIASSCWHFCFIKALRQLRQILEAIKRYLDKKFKQ
jgi:hypothetical protein